MNIINDKSKYLRKNDRGGHVNDEKWQGFEQ